MSAAAHPLSILYHDDCLVAVNKPAGMLVHRSWLDMHETRFVMQTLRDQIGQYVYPLHRLDRPTSGVLLFALSPETARQMAVQFEQHCIEKHYLAVVRGWLLDEGRINYALKEPLDKIADCMAQPDKAAQAAVSDYACLGVAELPYACGPHQSSRFSLLRLSPLTGRKHQLRRHMKHVFHPILGDSNYGDKKQNRAFAAYTGVGRLMLHAQSLLFDHPRHGGRMRIEAPCDAAWQQAEAALALRLPENMPRVPDGETV